MIDLLILLPHFILNTCDKPKKKTHVLSQLHRIKEADLSQTGLVDFDSLYS